MPVERVQLQAGHFVEQVLDGRHAVEVPAFVQHERAPREGRGVGNHAARHDDGAVFLLSQLTQGLQGVQKALFRVGSGDDLLLAVGRLHGQPIGLVVVVQRRLIEPEYQIGFLSLIDENRRKSGLAERLLDIIPIESRLRVEPDQHGVFVNGLILECDDFGRFGNDLDSCALGCGAARGQRQDGQ